MQKTLSSGPAAGAAAAADGLPVPRRYWSILAIWLAITMAVLDGAIANVALPSIARELNATPAASIWVINAYQIAITVSLLPLAALGDRLGYHRVYMAGLSVFTLGSLGCALSHTLTMLVAARVLQGLGAAGIMAINAALIRFTFPHRLLGRGIGMNAVVVSLASALGPTIAAAILGVASWEWLFAVNVPIGVVAVAVASRALPRIPGSGRKFDYVSAILNALAFGFLMTGAEGLVRESLPVGLAKLLVGVVAAALLVRREYAVASPLVPIDLVRIPIVGLSAATSVVSFAAMTLAYVAMPFYLQGPMGRSAVETGFLMTPWPLATAVTAPLAGRLADRYPAGILGGVGLVVLAVGLVALAVMSPHAAAWDVAWRMAVCGAGFGFFQSPNNRTMIGSAPLHRSGAAGGMLATARLIGQTSGALATAVVFHLAGTRATNLALGGAACVAAAAAGLSLLRLRVSPPAHAPTREQMRAEEEIPGG